MSKTDNTWESYSEKGSKMRHAIPLKNSDVPCPQSYKTHKTRVNSWMQLGHRSGVKVLMSMTGQSYRMHCTIYICNYGLRWQMLCIGSLVDSWSTNCMLYWPGIQLMVRGTWLAGDASEEWIILLVESIYLTPLWTYNEQIVVTVDLLKFGKRGMINKMQLHFKEDI